MKRKNKRPGITGIEPMEQVDNDFKYYHDTKYTIPMGEKLHNDITNALKEYLDESNKAFASEQHRKDYIESKSLK